MIWTRIFLILILCTTVAGQSAPETQLDTLRAEGFQALYNLDYEGARRLFQKMVDVAPDHPAGAQNFAASLWLQQLNESWELKSTLYSDKAYTSGKGRVDPRQAEEFRKWTRRAKQIAEARLRRDPRDVEALYYLGAAEGLEAAFTAAVERRFMAALRTGSSAVDHHRKVLELSPQFYDAELTIGIQNYVIGALPLPLKMVAGTIGVRGSKKRGLKLLEHVAAEGQRGRDVARVMLVDLYKREKRWDDAIAVARELSEKYPRNYLFKLQLADAMALRIAAARKSKDAKVSTSPTDEKELFSIFESLLRDKTLPPQTTELIQFRRNEALRLLK